MTFRTAIATTAALLALAPAAHADAPKLAAYASLAAAQPITVTCDTPTDAAEAGWTRIGSHAISLNPAACRALAHLAHHDSWISGTTDSIDNTALAGQAIQVLVHEATHLRLASGDESLVECVASRNYWPAVAAFHLPARLARRVLAAATYTHQNLKSATYKETC